MEPSPLRNCFTLLQHRSIPSDFSDGEGPPAPGEEGAEGPGPMSILGSTPLSIQGSAAFRVSDPGQDSVNEGPALGIPWIDRKDTGTASVMNINVEDTGTGNVGAAPASSSGGSAAPASSSGAGEQRQSVAGQQRPVQPTHGLVFVPGQQVQPTHGLVFVPGQQVQPTHGLVVVPGQQVQPTHGLVVVPGQQRTVPSGRFYHGRGDEQLTVQIGHNEQVIMWTGTIGNSLWGQGGGT